MPELPRLHQVIEAPGALSIGEGWRIEGENADRVSFRGVRPGEAFTVRDTRGHWYRARLHRIGSGARAELLAEAFEAISSPESPLSLALLQAVPARERMIWVVQKATELGAHSILPVFTERSLGADDLKKEKAHRWPAAILRAVAQCRRGSVPILLPPLLLGEALAHATWQEAEVRWALVERHDEGPMGSDTALAASAALLVGPEGGWTEAEIRRIEESGAVPRSLGARVLRTETAAVTGLALLQQVFGDLSL